MLDFMRRSASSVFAWLVLGALALVFGLQFGLPSDSLSFGKKSYAKAFGESIGEDEYRFQLNLIRRAVPIPKDARFQQMIGLKEEVLETAIEREVLVDRAHTLGLEATVKDAEDLVLAGHFVVLGETLDWLDAYGEPAFNYGLFTKSFLAGLQVSEPKYLELQRRELLARTMRDVVIGSAAVSEGELRQAYEEGANRINLRYARYEPLRFGELVDPSAEEIEAYLGAHRDALLQQYQSQGSRFAKLPKQSRVWVIALDKPAPAAADDGTPPGSEPEGSKPPEAEPEGTKPKDGTGDAKPAKPSKPKKGQPADPLAAVREQLQSARTRIVGGEDFRKLARSLSRHESAARGGEIGWVSETTGTGVDPAVDAAVPGLELGKVSEVIEGDKALFLVLVRQRREGDIAEADALPELAEEGVRREKGLALARTAAQEDLDMIAGGAALTDVFAGGSALGGEGGIEQAGRDARRKVQLDETGSFAKGETVPGLGPAPAIVAAAWATAPDQGLMPEVFEVGNDLVLAGVVEKSEATDAGFAAARPELYEQAVRRKGNLVVAKWTQRQCIEGKARGDVHDNTELVAKLMTYESQGEDGAPPSKPYELCDRVGNRGGLLRSAAGRRGGFGGDE
ncbi:MAG: SurA N-terminal domain-containing protein [Nannocystaceae bacterium]|nr:SurA N-terminal domain-containing protein [Nannocystaceae bacterium]